MSRAHLIIVNERNELAWILSNAQMAFPSHRLLAGIEQGHEFLIHTTRGCFHNPRRDRGRVIGRAILRSGIRKAPAPVEIGGRNFSHLCDLKITGLTAVRTGVELAPLVPEMTTFPNKEGWRMQLRRTTLALTDRDAGMLRKRLDALSTSPEEVLPGYLDAAGISDDARPAETA